MEDAAALATTIIRSLGVGYCTIAIHYRSGMDGSGAFLPSRMQGIARNMAMVSREILFHPGRVGATTLARGDAAEGGTLPDGSSSVPTSRI